MNKAAQVVKPISRYWDGSFNTTDNHRYFSYNLKVPETAFGIRATVRYYGHGNYLGLGLYNSGRLRAYGRTFQKDGKIELTAELWADVDTPGSVAGAVLPGTWQEKKLNFLSITDHNNIFNWRKLPGNTQDILPLPAMEVTTFHGHANAFGIVDWVDWRTGQNDRTINEIADNVHKLGGLFSVNHPCTPGLPDGHASWRHQDFDWQPLFCYI